MILRCLKPGFDRLAFSTLVARLEDDLGIDPFTISADASFPLTRGGLIRPMKMPRQPPPRCVTIAIPG